MLESSTQDDITPAMRAEASAWIARLHGPQRNPRTEAGFRSWLKASPAHARAFAQTTEAWEAMGSVPAEQLSSMVRWDRVGSPRTTSYRPILAAAAMLAAVAIAALFYFRADPVTATAIGEQRVVTLQDGTRVYLNTASRLLIGYDKHTRHIDLESGEALFQVAKDPHRPFTVRAGGREVTALGTTFLVRHEKDLTAITLIDGKVSVSTDRAKPSALAPGERLTFSRSTEPRMDRPALERVMAWQRGLVVLDSTQLTEAVAEMNRYSAIPLEIANPEAANVRVSGAFRAGDSLSFAQAVAATYRLRVQSENDRIVLSGNPQATY